MVVRITTGKSIRGVLRYNENKVENGQASLLMANGFLQLDPDYKEKLQRFDKLTKLNIRTKTNALHISLNFSPEDKLDADTMKRIATEYMERIGFGGQPYLVYLHHDAGHPHLHVATCNIDGKGRRLETHNLGRLRSEPARKQIEKDFGLVVAEEQGHRKRFLLQPLEPVEYGKKETKAAVTKAVQEVLYNYRFTSLGQMNAILGHFNVTAYRGEPGSRMHEKKGLVYSIVDQQGNRVGVPIKASELYEKPTLSRLEKTFERNSRRTVEFRAPLKETVSKALWPSGSMEQFREKLSKEGIGLVIRQNGEGRVYGLTYIDFVNRCVFNGSQLGKGLSAKGVQDRFAAISRPCALERLNEETVEVIIAPIIGSRTREEILDMLFHGAAYEPVPYPLKRKKKKQRRPKL
ncbi:relaxase/mobilization nuclease domain-containing protein [Echinicola vietnamensis]|uniref:Relaxase/mobilization nuclease n=1 Tax=Echinicola vietnamensis (strain DSM 17526 / LMG 23754 / KMM 6221) TaxID=926556 RepID=L0G441_ECHVK|nr:relaxase/mobilization nuclease domain-containing protein [Echinicola vietnamensis]AGA80307.1 relaxase/mobilization nuclease [Echinicola vietnamensis DSM 17526]